MPYLSDRRGGGRGAPGRAPAGAECSRGQSCEARTSRRGARAAGGCAEAELGWREGGGGRAGGKGAGTRGGEREGWRGRGLRCPQPRGSPWPSRAQRAPGQRALASCARRSRPAPQRPSRRRRREGAGQTKKVDKGGRSRAALRAPGEAGPLLPVRKSRLGAARGAWDGRRAGSGGASGAARLGAGDKGPRQGVLGGPQQWIGSERSAAACLAEQGPAVLQKDYSA